MKRYCSALFWIRFKGKEYPIAPLRSLGYLLLFVLFFGITVYTVEFYFANFIVSGATPETSSALTWQEENRKLSTLLSQKLHKLDASLPTSESKQPVWHSAGIPYPGPKSAGEKRILVVGDSFVWGDGYENANDIWWRQLQRELNSRGYGHVKVVAAGLNGASTQDQLAWLKRLSLADKLEADIIVVGYVTNDPDIHDDSGTSLVKQNNTATNYSDSRNLPIIPDHYSARLFPNVIEKLQDRRSRKWLANSSQEEKGYPYAVWELMLLQGKNFAVYNEVLAEFSEYVASIEAPVFFMTLPNSPNKAFYSVRYEPILKAFSDNGLKIYNTLPRMLETFGMQLNNSNWAINPANGHPSPLSTRLYAKNAVDILIKDYPNIVGEATYTIKEKPHVNDWLPVEANVQQEAPAAYTYELPSTLSGTPYMRVGKPHIIMNFETPENIKSIKIESDFASREIFISRLAEDGHDPQIFKSLGEKHGSALSWKVPPGAPISSIRIGFPPEELNTKNLRTVKTLDKSKIKKGYGQSYTYPLPEFRQKSDDSSYSTRSPFRLLVDGKPVSDGHYSHNIIIKNGHGAYSHWGNNLIFSTQDNTDPRENGRTYSIALVEKKKNKETIRFDFYGPEAE
jgi:lysophospholipase L1-like esterase